MVLKVILVAQCAVTWIPIKHSSTVLFGYGDVILREHKAAFCYPVNTFEMMM